MPRHAAETNVRRGVQPALRIRATQHEMPLERSTDLVEQRAPAVVKTMKPDDRSGIHVMRLLLPGQSPPWEHMVTPFLSVTTTPHA